MTSDWKEYKLQDIALINPTESLKKGELAKKVSMDVLIPFYKKVPSCLVEKYNGGTKFRNGDTIMARITPCLENGKTAKVDILDDNEIGFGSTEYIVFRAIDNKTDSDYLYYLITSSQIREPAIKSMVGSSGRQRVQTDVVKDLSILLPPLETQQKIAKVLSVIDDKIELNNKINENLEQQAQAIFKSWFVNNDREYPVGQLSDIAEITMGQSPVGSSYNENKEGILFFQGRAEFGTRYPSPRLYTTEPKRFAKANDVLMSVRAPVGDVNIAIEDCCIGRGLASLRSKNGTPSYLWYTLLSLKKQLNVFNGEGTVFGSINKDSLNTMEINLIPNNEIWNFENVVSKLDKQIHNNFKENQYLTQLRDTLLPKLMSGEIDLSNIDILDDKLLFDKEKQENNGE